jgi:hypothetical protein
MKVIDDSEFLVSIKAFLERTGMKPTRFGREAVGEASFIASLESGRSPSLKVVNKVAQFMQDYVADASDASGSDDATEAEAA